ncbi:hypothetical protein [Alkalibacillus salilacus]|uniref:Uncharacterized protein n=1 Tax=Alkalibacillus salilacus TaxID=284582 RepID=A0ABT9VJC9_9BACI|nr:hypothetical protein [Alkalibacillus salilacus]MDQ0160905.1 hypothetical protein [Alkalibacillus salilacus]
MNKELYGKVRLINLLKSEGNRSVKVIEDHIIISHFEFIGVLTRKDGMTMVI